MLRIFILLIVTCVLPVSTNAASFDCSKASSKVEKMICTDEALSAADEKLAEAYKTARTSSSDKQALKEQQRNWINN